MKVVHEENGAVGTFILGKLISDSSETNLWLQSVSKSQVVLLVDAHFLSEHETNRMGLTVKLMPSHDNHRALWRYQKLI